MALGRTQVMHEVVEIGVSGLVAGDVVGATSQIDTARENGVRIDKVRGALTWKDKTTTIGPIAIGVTVGSFTTSEVEEALEADPQSHDDGPITERANRPVWTLWVIPASTEVNKQHEVKMTDLYWPFKEVDEGEQIIFWAHNLDTSTLTAATFQINLNWVYTWMRD